LDGKDVSSAQFKGKVVVLDFWATWCVPCREEIPGYVELQKKYGKDGLVIIGVAFDEKVAPVKKFVEKFKVDYPIVMGTEEFQKAFDAVDPILPTTFLIDRSGQIRDRKTGAEPKEDYEKKIVGFLK